jgi:uncharacterized protein YlzI (FlbEa/FlbD family)
MFIQLTDEKYEKFYLNVQLIETIVQTMGGKSVIHLTTGRSITCLENPEKVTDLIFEL